MPLPIHIAFCVNDAYVPYVCVAVKSIIENHKGKGVVIHVLTDDISARNERRLFEVIRGNADVKINIYVVDDTSLRGLKDTWSIYTWYRLLITQYVGSDVHRILYLDADTIVSGSLEELFKIDMNDLSIAGCIDPESFNEETFSRCGYDMKKKYICAGVLLMNLDYWREHQLADQMIKWGHKNNDWIKFPDQDTINVLCQDTKIILPLRYGVMDYFFKEDRFYHEPYREQLRDCIERPTIIHYAGRNPWKRELATSVMQDEWDKYNRMLKHPAKKIYITKGMNLAKLLVWNVLHPRRCRQLMCREDVIRKLRSNQ